jgi:hypothetical protein
MQKTHVTRTYFLKIYFALQYLVIYFQTSNLSLVTPPLSLGENSIVYGVFHWQLYKSILCYVNLVQIFGIWIVIAIVMMRGELDECPI